MERVTIFGDIHGNLPALDAVLADMHSQGLSPDYCLGDLVGYGTFPNEVTEVIRDRNIPTIMGNYDQGVGKNSDDCGCAYTSKDAESLGKRSIAWTNQHTSADNKFFLQQLSAQIPWSYMDCASYLYTAAHGKSMNIYTTTAPMPL